MRTRGFTARSSEIELDIAANPFTLSSMDLILAIAFSLILGGFIGYRAHERLTQGCPTIPNPPAAPLVTVVVPTDYKPLDPLMVDGKLALVGPRALLFWTVYHAAIKAFSGNGTWTLDTDQEYEACETAKAAVRSVYGETFDA